VSVLRRAGLLAIVQVLAAAIALLIALYLSAVKLSGDLPACLPGGGCETVALSEYSSLFGVPVAFLGALFSAVLAATVVAGLGTGDRRIQYATYALALLGTVFVAYLTYLELFVIHAICQWCVGYAICTVVTFVGAALRLRWS
jgi:uncharacterized membrane protein